MHHVEQRVSQSANNPDDSATVWNPTGWFRMMPNDFRKWIIEDDSQAKLRGDHSNAFTSRLNSTSPIAIADSHRLPDADRLLCTNQKHLDSRLASAISGRVWAEALEHLPMSFEQRKGIFQCFLVCTTTAPSDRRCLEAHCEAFP